MTTSTLLTGLALLGALANSPAAADAGHDHGPAAPTATADALPRFSAASELFELVGVVQGRTLTVYLDRASDNAPVEAAQIELQIADAKVELKAHGPGEFEGTLAQALAPGLTAVTATITAGGEADVLAAEIDLHEAAHAEPTTRRPLTTTAALLAVLVAALVTVIFFLRRRAATRRAV